MKLTPSILAVLLLVTGCRQHKESADVKMQKELTGTWKFEAKYAHAHDIEITITYSSDGSYVCETSIPGRTYGPQIVNLEGIYRVKDGVLVETLIKDSQTDAPVPETNNARIVHIDSRKLVLVPQETYYTYPTNPIVFLKQIK